MLNAAKHLPGLVSSSKLSKSVYFSPTVKNTSALIQNVTMRHNPHLLHYELLGILGKQNKTKTKKMISSHLWSKLSNIYFFTPCLGGVWAGGRACTSMDAYCFGMCVNLECVLSPKFTNLKWKVCTYSGETKEGSENLISRC